MRRSHTLKTWPEFFAAIRSGEKTFEARKADRDYQVGDVLILTEWVPETGKPTGEFEERTVTYMLHGGQFGIEEGHVIMGIKP